MSCSHLQLSVTQQTRLSTHSRHSVVEPTRPRTQETTSPVMPRSVTGTPAREPAAARTGTRQLVQVGPGKMFVEKV